MIERLELAESALNFAQGFIAEALAALAVVRAELEELMTTETLTIKLTGVEGVGGIADDETPAYPDHTGTLKIG